MSSDPAFDAEWTRCAPWLEDALALAGHSHSLDDVKALVEARSARFWAYPACAMVTTVETYPSFDALHIWLAGGDIDELVSKARPAAEAWALQQGCHRSIVFGRRGWAKVLSAEGYRPEATIFEKVLG